jgi:hypothetical protein
MEDGGLFLGPKLQLGTAWFTKLCFVDQAQLSIALESSEFGHGQRFVWIFAR